MVTGSVLRAADDVRISVQLVQAASDSCLWAKGYERRLVDVLSLQREVASAVANEIHGTTTGLGLAHATAPRPVDPEAYTLCLKGRHLWHRVTEPEIYRALEYFHAALVRDPECAPGHSGIAICHLGLGWLAVLPHQAFPRSKAAAMRALELDPSHVMARWTLGIALTCRQKYDLAIAELEDVVRTWPGIPLLGWLGAACARSGNRDRARELLARIESSAPEQAARSTEMARILTGLGESDAALVALVQACEAREAALGYIGSDPSWDEIAGDDRFKGILRRMGLPGSIRQPPSPVSATGD